MRKSKEKKRERKDTNTDKQENKVGKEQTRGTTCDKRRNSDKT